MLPSYKIIIINLNVNYLALELKERRIKTILRKLDPLAHRNVKIARIFVDKTIVEYIALGSFEKIYIIHPDPWPKRKHFKNRIIQKEFIAVLREILKPHGEIIISTDHQEYAEWIVDHFKKNSGFTVFFENGFTHTAHQDHIETHFEKKKKEEGFNPFYMKFIKNDL